MENTVNRLIDKSIESFLMAIEVYNKPTIHYRIEDSLCSFVMLGSYCLRHI